MKKDEEGRSLKIPAATLDLLKDEQYNRRKSTGHEPTLAELIQEAVSIFDPNLRDINYPSKNSVVILRANRTLGLYDGRIEETMRFVGEFFPTFTEEEEELLRRICESLALNIQVTIRGEARAGQQHQGNPDIDPSDIPSEKSKTQSPGAFDRDRERLVRADAIEREDRQDAKTSRKHGDRRSNTASSEDAGKHGKTVHPPKQKNA